MSRPSSARLYLVAFGVLAAVHLQVGCFDARIPDSAVVGCRDDAECPVGFRCAPVLAICASAEDFGRLCGDGVRAGDEECDDGEANDDAVANACRTDCTTASCGDAVVDEGEACDDGPANSDTATDACRGDCTPPQCGDGVVDSAEECDDGDENDDLLADACRRSCQFARCGDNVLDSGERCDDGAQNSDVEPGACRQDCQPSACGDAVVDPGEACDDGPANSDGAPDACRTSCVRATCGDEVVDGGEVCDDGNEDSGDGCRQDCRKVERCGDVLVDVGEDCDDGNDNPADGCDACRTSVFRVDVLIGGAAPEPRTRVSLSDAAAIVADGNGRLFVAEARRNRVLRVDTDGTVSVVAGSGAAGFSGDGDRAVVARLRGPRGLALDNGGRLYIADTGNHRIRRVDVNGTIATVAGSGVAGFGGDDANALAASLNGPMGVHIDRAGQLLIADTGNHRIRRVDVDATITTIAGTGTSSSSTSFFRCPQQLPLFPPLKPLATAASSPRAVLEDANGHVVFAAAGDGCVRRINGDVLETPLDGLGEPGGLALAADGDLLIVDTGRHTVLRLEGERSTTLAGRGAAGFSLDGAASSTLLNAPAGVAVSPDGAVFVADTENARVGRIDPTRGAFETWVGARPFVGDGSPATSALLSSPTGIAPEDDGFLIADTGNHRIRRVDGRGEITTVVGRGVPGSDGADGPAVDAFLRRPEDVAADGTGGMVVADTGNDRILLVDGQGAIAASFPADDPSAVIRADDGTVFFAERATHSVARRALDGTVTRLAGTGAAGFAGDNAAATTAQLNAPSGLALVGADLFVADTGNGRIRRINAQGVITTVVGKDCTVCRPQDGPVANVSGIRPRRLGVDSVGRLLFFDSGRGIRRLDAGQVTTVFSTSTNGSFTLDDEDNPVVADTTASEVFVRRGTPAGNVPLAGAFDPVGPGPFTTARLYPPRALAVVDANLLVSVGAEGRALGIDLREASVDIVVGAPSRTSATGPARSSLLLADPRSVVFDAPRGRLVFGEHAAGALRLIDVDVDDDGTVDAPATWSSSVFASSAAGIAGVAVDDGGFVVALDDEHCVVRLDDAGQVREPPVVGECGSGGPPPLLDSPSHVARSRSGALYVSDTGNNAVLRVDADGGVDVVVGLLGEPSSSGQGTPAREFPVNRPGQLAFDSVGNLYIASTTTVRLVSLIDDRADPDGRDRIQTIYGNGSRGQFPERDSQCIAALALDAADTVYVADRCLGFVVTLTRPLPP